MFVKARHQGNSIVLTIPKSINVKANTEYSVMQGEDGSIIYKPVNKQKYDIWSDHSLDNLDYEQIQKQEYQDLGYNPRELKPVGKEKFNG
ncbi:MAG: AbrB family toxin-antitoxin system antitoxin [Lactobacillus sp.]|jgi:antitoxin component of MazEF toxin-antitoxin module|nr:AbrB family toxin-antitoxin system antitoxin [Lactobacillus sp.]MCH3906334.1 AbrB family toxin-antitoxin system antitoxin [Lactobacillus sp.]MCH3990092.1 AbrB family toxin-antitoxin system antitoxin [Lactobacillus sp.]MCH4069194.1 AbrB family toxin-antitoxin system antitoxin [Lactobacillus sp.]MCI1303496.1 AbrB family toxin-antitoxin system antitoxin [Lactobacillus sp.]